MTTQSEVVSIRLDSRVKYFSDILARLQSTSLTGLVGDVLRSELDKYALHEDELWASHPADRLALIGNRFPQLLSTRQRMLWQRVICLDQMYWKVPLTGVSIEVSEDTFNFALLRESWGELNRNQDVVAEKATALMQQLNIQVRRITHEPGSQWKEQE